MIKKLFHSVVGGGLSSRKHSITRRCDTKIFALRSVSLTALLLLFLWPAIYSGQPLFSPDTSAYARGFDAGLIWLSGRTSAWTTWAYRLAKYQGREDATVGQRAADDVEVAESKSFQSPKFILAGRSVSYGALLYLGELFGGLWITVAIQAAAALAALGLTLKRINTFSWPRFVLVGSVLGLLSSLPFCASFLLPDIFAGLAILAAANLAVLGGRLKRWELIFWISILVAAVVFHPTHLGIIMILFAAAAVTRLLTKRISSVAVLALAFAATIGFASEIGFDFVVAKVLGVEVSRPPVIMARVVADGPGAEYLREKCPEARLVACEFVDRLSSNSDAFLWDTSSGAYAPAPIEKRQELGNEQYRFAASVFLYNPIGVIKGALINGFIQLGTSGLSDFTSSTPANALPLAVGSRPGEDGSWKKEFPSAALSAMTVSVATLSLIFIGITLIKFWKVIPGDQKLFCFSIILGLISNAFICGALSGPHDRYQARLMWLLPVVALVLYYGVYAAAGRLTMPNVTLWGSAMARRWPLPMPLARQKKASSSSANI